jgi:menaquinone-dependent protoporphyrinogen oxidase
MREEPLVSEPKVLIVFHTSEGQTAKIAERIAEVLRADGLSADVREAEVAPAPAGYDGVVVGDSIHVHHSRQVVRYVQDHVEALDVMPTALFQVSMTSARPDEAHEAAAHGLVNELLDKTTFDPDVVGIFAGRLAYTQYGWFKRHLMQAITKREGGDDTDTTRDVEYTDWAAVEHFAHDVGAMIRQASSSWPG